MTTVVHTRESDSEGYITLLFDGPVGQTGAGEYVRAETPAGPVEVLLHGQDRVDLPAAVTKVVFEDGGFWKPAKS